MAVTYGKYKESDVIKGCSQNDRKYQEILYRHHFQTMLHMVYRFTRDEDTALQILNDGFLKVFRKIDRYSGQGSFQGWVRRIVYRSISDHFRKERGYLKMIVLDEPEKNTQHTPLDDLYYEDLLSIVEMLPEKSRDVFKYYAIEGYSHKEIGEMMGFTEGTSKWHLSKARERLQDLIRKRTNQQLAG
jgi:RNA polymerase sigma-70 factor (ECF subfamily)